MILIFYFLNNGYIIRILVYWDGVGVVYVIFLVFRFDLSFWSRFCVLSIKFVWIKYLNLCMDLIGLNVEFGL